MKNYDIIIVGGGIVGATAAILLAQSGASILVLEKKPADIPNEEAYESRVSALSPQSIDILTSVGAWKMIDHQRKGCFHEMHVWDENSDGRIHFSRDMMGTSYLGFIIENNTLLRALRNQMNTMQGLTCLYDVTLEDFVNESSPHVVTNKGRFKSQLIIAADGANSFIKTLENIPSRYYKKFEDYAVTATVETEISHQYTAWQRFLTTGPIAFLPLQDEHRCSIVWSMPETFLREQSLHSREVFATQLAKALDYRLGKVKLLTDPLSFKIQRHHAIHYVKNKLVLLGDASHTVHPLAGQGLNLGLRGAKQLALSLSNCHLSNAIQLKRALRTFERCTKTQHNEMFLGIEGIKNLFTTSNPFAQWVRGAGLNILDKLSPIKKILIKRAMGF